MESTMITVYFDTAKDEFDIRQAMELYIADENRDLGLTRDQRTHQKIEHEFRYWFGIYQSTPERETIGYRDVHGVL